MLSTMRFPFLSTILALMVLSVLSKKTARRINDIEEVLPAKLKARIPPHIQVIPFGRPITAEDVKLFLYTRRNKQKGQAEVIRSNNINDVISSKYYNKSLPNFFVIHGSFSNYSTHVNDYIRPPLLSVADVNIFYVDYHAPAQDINIVPGTIFTVGRIVGNFINRLSDHYKLTPSDITVVGYSLGAHVSGIVGSTAEGKVGTIIGLDPAGLAVAFLNKSCAKFVQIIHTSNMLGYSKVMGHVDFFPNGGEKQPGCEDILCDHVRAVMYYGESLTTGGFTAVNCNNYSNFGSGRCDKNKTSYLGRINLDRNARGQYYLDTSAKSPFSIR